MQTSIPSHNKYKNKQKSLIIWGLNGKFQNGSIKNAMYGAALFSEIENKQERVTSHSV